MLYTTLFLVRYFPFWATPIALVLFEVGVYHFNRRERGSCVVYFVLSGALAVSSILWIVFEGYWRAGPFVKKFLESF